MNSQSLEDRIHLLEEKIHQLEAINKSLQNEVITDPLTQAYNRRALESLLPTLISKARTENIPFSLIIIDVDYLKEINDTFGHLEGDQVLKVLVSVLQNNLRKSDWVIRFGGEEFLILLPAMQEKECKSLAERLRASVQNFPDLKFNLPSGYHSNPNCLTHVTISLGATTYRPGDDTEALMRRADAALYFSKRSGRNLASYCKIRMPLSRDFLSLTVTKTTQSDFNDRLMFEKIAPSCHRIEVMTTHQTAQII